MNTLEKFRTLVSVIETAGVAARDYFDSDEFSNEQKSDGSVVTAVDAAVEATLRSYIATHFPADAIVGEEAAAVAGTSGYVWHIDPIDGTDNFLRKIPFCAISVARLGDTNEGSCAVVHNPITHHTFASFQADGVTENERLITMSPEPLGGRYVLTLGRGRGEPWMKAAAYTLAAGLGNEFGACRPYGCSALELAYLAAGRVDGYVTFGLHSYDYAAGLYLVRAAGGAISVFRNGGWQRWEGSIKALCHEHGQTIFASHLDVHDRMCTFIGDPRAWAA